VITPQGGQTFRLVMRQRCNLHSSSPSIRSLSCYRRQFHRFHPGRAPTRVRPPAALGPENRFHLLFLIRKQPWQARRSGLAFAGRIS
jgi:hypothetical protein